MEPMSTLSTRDIFVSQFDVAAIEVGRVIVAVIRYEIVPRSNCSLVSKATDKSSHVAEVKTYINARREAFRRKLQLKIKLVYARLKSPFTTQRLLILEKRAVAIAKILRFAWITRSCQPKIRQGLVRRIWVLEDAHEAMEADGEMGDADRLDDLEDHGAFDQVAG